MDKVRIQISQNERWPFLEIQERNKIDEDGNDYWENSRGDILLPQEVVDKYNIIMKQFEEMQDYLLELDEHVSRYS